jgi:hypothetical protein
VVRLAAALALLLLASPSAVSEPRPLTFVVAGDTHLGVPGLAERNRSLIEQMNLLPGQRWPEPIGGQVDTPRGLLVVGDLTDDGTAFSDFTALYGLTGRDGHLHYPVYETIGNHDWGWDSPAKLGVRERHGDVAYAWDWEGVHFASLGVYPNAERLAWLQQDLARVGTAQRVILFFHFSLEGPYSDDWTAAEKDAFAEAIEPYNIVAIFHGHYHRHGHYLWRGHDVFRPGSPRHAGHTFLAVRLRADQLAVGTWDFDAQRWLLPVEQFVKALSR